MSQNQQSITTKTLIDNQARLVNKLQQQILEMASDDDLRNLREGHSALSMAIDKLASLRIQDSPT